MSDKVNFVLSVGPCFNSYNFYAEFKDLQAKGHFKHIERVKKLDLKTGRER